ncbi:hypothetical protein [Sulfurimonas marina]|uniref:Porin family protein n=1 Tax=Sulfurimonas marina TaxID=2590551 RepID=A0A7M1AX02_9BACT|nr:hypothetical protein [Sulfurimonas marina]QOP41945.1 hypothetical protein FJR03_09445 [Sulfurimonas marina]
MKNLVLKMTTLALLSANLYAGNGTFSISLVNMELDYTETDVYGNFADSENSNSILGFELGYGLDLSCSNYGCSNLEFNFSGLTGNSNYDGFKIKTGEPYQGTTFNILYDFSVDYTMKKEFSAIDLIYGAGAGYHAWYRELSSIQNELYSWFYITPIVGVSKELIDNFNIGVIAKYKYGIAPTMIANSISDEFKLGSANTFELSIPVEYSYTDEVNFFIEYIYSRQVIKRSNFLSGYIDGDYYENIYEPDSRTNDKYIKIGASIKY